MLVVPESAFLSSTHQNFSFGSPWLNVGALAVKATDLVDAGPDALAIAAANRANRLILDDGYSIRADSRRAHLRAAVLHGGRRGAQRRPVQLAGRWHGARLGLRRLAAAAAGAAVERLAGRVRGLLPDLDAAEPAHGCAGRRRRRHPGRRVQRLQLLHDLRRGRARRIHPGGVRGAAVQDRRGDQRARCRRHRPAGDRELGEARRAGRRGAGEPGGCAQRGGRDQRSGPTCRRRRRCTIPRSPTSSPARSSTSPRR